MKYPFVVLYRHEKYSFIDDFFKENNEKLNFSIVKITSHPQDLNMLYNSSNQLLISFGENENEYNYEINNVICPRIRKRWIHYTKIDDVQTLNNGLNYCFINNVTAKHEFTRPIFSLFTTCFNSYEKIIRAYNSLKEQTLKDWEWIVIDDSTDDEHFQFLKLVFKNDARIRLYKKDKNSGNIGNVKNEAVSLCRGQYVLEMDHDDEIMTETLQDAANVFDENQDVGFVYMDFTNIYEDGRNYRYGELFGLGYSSYYCQKYKNQWVYVACTPNINNITLCHIVGVPNHPRIWRKETLLKIGNYSEFLPIADDYELILRTAVNTKMAKIHKMGYIQYMNNNNNNFSLIRNSEINRLVPFHIMPQCYNDYDIQNKMKELGAYEDEKYMYQISNIWKRENYKHIYCNLLLNLNYKKQYCIVGLDALRKHKTIITELYKNPLNDFIVIDNTYEIKDVTNELDYLNMDKMKCYCLKNHTNEEMINYFYFIYKSCDKHAIIEIKNTNEEVENLLFQE